MRKEVIILKWSSRKSSSDINKIHVPTIDDFSQEATQKAVLSDTIQHPMTIYPAGVSVVTLLYMSLISCNPASFAVCFGAGLLSLSSWIFNFFIRLINVLIFILNKLI